ncbi:Core histone H2A/H2B/H3/H4 family protein [Coccidioides posadasii C735 delta SOWgp]|uniref:Histone H3 n=1 Tax=Coccidioides posadasii (strain C735) TaxID=222929 RepID=C5PE32_COCP7|nr:Core histone H2A/H2B/H3/H4 family protein [Coccidioides posadasii C735 delta SOWgp]EER25343.1 Core histone H2A/H2B/H3/H4 family protein [Coccidioides posadasii C735 delta SOWgp]|eukprot:XP_003067488.1 Core histone H2A/H2B/H3/H4 family protein [Coccidioides posadasii C735 delta SOWgp]
MKKANWRKANKDVDLVNFDQENPRPPVHNWKAGTCAIKKIHHFQSSTELIFPVAPFQRLVREITLSCYQGHEYRWQRTAIESLQEAAEATLCALFECSVMAMAHRKRVTVNTDDMKLVLGISAKIGSNYFGPIDAPDRPAPAATTRRLRAGPAPPTTASLPPPGSDRVSAHQMAGIRAPVRFTKPVLAEQEEEEDDDDNDNDDDDDDEVAF